MADDSKISLLPEADVLDGSEVFPIVQSGSTKQAYFYDVQNWLGSFFVISNSGSVDNAIARFDGTNGLTIQDSAVTIADTTGEISGGGLFKSTVSDGASAVGYVLDTTNALSTSGAKLFALKNHGSLKLSVDKDGGLILVLPSSDPHVVGKLWNDSGTVKVSAG